MNKHIIIWAPFLIVLIFSSCKGHDEEGYHNIMDTIEKKSRTYQGALTSEPYILEYKSVEIKTGDQTFLVPDRKSEIKSFACSECHIKPLDVLKREQGIKKAHWNIELHHADDLTMNCTTCHNNDDMDQLRSLTGKKIDFNMSFNLCSQCHSKQFNDWKGGAHGKRIGGWAPPRLSLNCVNCHNPHKPHFEKRFPARFNTKYETERK